METMNLTKYTNKQVKIILNNGKEINSKIVYIDTVENTIDFEDGRSIAISFIKELVHGENKDSITTNHVVAEITSIIPKSETTTKDDFIVEKTPIETLKPDTILVSEPQNNSKHIEVLKKLMEIEMRYDNAIKNLQIISLKPEISAALPKQIKNLENGAKTEQATLWNKIVNQYNNAVKNGGLYQNKNGLNTIVSNTQSLVKLMPNSNFYELLAYFALENKELYLACWALENVFKDYESISKNEQAWYKFVELILVFSNYKALFHIISTVSLSSFEQEKIFKAVCYSLIKLNRKNIVENLIEKTFGSKPDFKSLALDGLKELPKEPLSVYMTFKANLEIKPVKIVENSSVTSHVNNATKNNPNNNLPSHLQGYVSRGSNAETLRKARIERDVTKNFAKAETLFISGIENENSPDIKSRAVRDLASMLGQQMKEPKRGIEVIKKYQEILSDSDLHLLYTLYFQAGEYNEAIKIQKQILQNTSRKDLRMARYFGLASCYIELGNFKEAEGYYRQALKINPSQYTIERNIALCLYKQGKNDEAKKILIIIIADYGDINSQKLLDTIDGKNQNTDFVFDTTGLVFENLDNFANFYLSACDFKYVEKNRIEEGKYIGSDDNKRADIDKLVRTASTLRSRIAEERSNIYLNAARIYYDLGEQDNDFYNYLCRSFTSKGDNAVQSNNELDTVRTFYLTALKVYDALYFDEGQNQKKDEQDAINALCRFLYSFLGRDRIPVLMSGDKNLSIKETLNFILVNSSDRNKIFFALAFIFSKSPQYSMNRVLKILFENQEFKKVSCLFLDVSVNSTQEQFAEVWKKQATEIIKRENELSAQLSPLRNFQIAEIWLSSSIDRIENSINNVFFPLDKDYLADLENLLNNCISLCKASDFDDKNNKIEDIKVRAENLMQKMLRNPTKLAIEEVHPILNNLLNSLDKYLSILFSSSKPDLAFSSVFTAYQLKNSNQIDLQIKIENKSEGHAEEVELRLEANPTYFKSKEDFIVFYKTIKGKKSDSKIIELELTEKAIQEKAFSIKIDASFKNRLNESFISPSESLAVQLGEQKDFVEIKPNPYANGASGKAVTNDEMFYGRKEYIESAYKTMVEDGISYVIYGQFRSGKSSILTHLEKKLESNPQIIVVKLGDIGKFMGESSTPMFYRFLHQILRALRDEVNKKIKIIKLSFIDFVIPDSKVFYEHPEPVDYFYELMDNFQSQKNDLIDWENIRIIVSMDEFTYIYEKIVKGELSSDFMKNWKALLAKNYFNVVLVAQDVFPKFFAEFENAFGTIFPKRITYLDNQNARELIDEPIKRLNKNESKFRENAIDKIIELTAGHPWYIQIFCDALINYINTDKQQYITGANIDKVKERLLRGTERKDNFKNFIENGDPSKDKISEKDTTIVLKKIAENTKNYDDGYCQKSTINCITKADLNEILKDLESREVIETHNEKGYKIRVGLFKEWLNENPNVWE